jgi:hypothetical protein
MRKLQRTQPGTVFAQLALAKAASAFAAATMGAMALGAVAVGRLFVRRIGVKEARFTRVSIDDLVVNRLRVREFIRDDLPPPPIR